MRLPKECARESANNYKGVERRRHAMYVTRNSEYHFRDGLCVAVRDRASGEWLSGHIALHRSISGSLKVYPNGAVLPNLGAPLLGESLFFATGGRDLVTSPLLVVARPSKNIVDGYPRPLKKR